MNGSFKAGTARAHLAATKKNGICAHICKGEDADAGKRQEYFRALITKVAEQKESKSRKRKQQCHRMDVFSQPAMSPSPSKKKKRQPKLKAFLKEQDAAAADIAVAQWAIAHDISPNAMKGIIVHDISPIYIY